MSAQLTGQAPDTGPDLDGGDDPLGDLLVHVLPLR
jgi:hypothetical protein